MNTLIVFDSEYGNTEQIARSMAEALAPGGEVRVLAAADVATPAALGDAPDLLLVGGPTQRHGASPNLVGFFDRLPRRFLDGVPAATFDTRYRMTRLLTGSAAVVAGRRLRRAGCRLVVPPESFFVEQDRPPDGGKRRQAMERLEDGELERARTWADAIASRLGGSPARG
jgi:flavodoxin